jgi:membrane peptidoglycan carboxypeptidase
MRIGGRGMTGGSYPAMIWGRMMSAWHDGLPAMDFADPERTRYGRYLSVDRSIDPRGGYSRRSDDRSSSRYRSRSRATTTTEAGGTAATAPAPTTPSTSPPTVVTTVPPTDPPPVGEVLRR